MAEERRLADALRSEAYSAHVARDDYMLDAAVASLPRGPLPARMRSAEGSALSLASPPAPRKASSLPTYVHESVGALDDTMRRITNLRLTRPMLDPALAHEYSVQWSRTRGQWYYFNHGTGEARWEPPRPPVDHERLRVAPMKTTRRFRMRAGAPPAAKARDREAEAEAAFRFEYREPWFAEGVRPRGAPPPSGLPSGRVPPRMMSEAEHARAHDGAVDADAVDAAQSTREYGPMELDGAGDDSGGHGGLLMMGLHAESMAEIAAAMNRDPAGGDEGDAEAAEQRAMARARAADPAGARYDAAIDRARAEAAGAVCGGGGGRSGSGAAGGGGGGGGGGSPPLDVFAADDHLDRFLAAADAMAADDGRYTEGGAPPLHMRHIPPRWRQSAAEAAAAAAAGLVPAMSSFVGMGGPARAPRAEREARYAGHENTKLFGPAEEARRQPHESWAIRMDEWAAPPPPPPKALCGGDPRLMEEREHAAWRGRLAREEAAKVAARYAASGLRDAAAPPRGHDRCGSIPSGVTGYADAPSGSAAAAAAGLRRGQLGPRVSAGHQTLEELEISDALGELDPAAVQRLRMAQSLAGRMGMEGGGGVPSAYAGMLYGDAVEVEAAAQAEEARRRLPGAAHAARLRSQRDEMRVEMRWRPGHAEVAAEARARAAAEAAFARRVYDAPLPHFLLDRMYDEVPPPPPLQRPPQQAAAAAAAGGAGAAGPWSAWAAATAAAAAGPSLSSAAAAETERRSMPRPRPKPVRREASRDAVVAATPRDSVRPAKKPRAAAAGLQQQEVQKQQPQGLTATFLDVDSDDGDDDMVINTAPPDALLP